MRRTSRSYLVFIFTAVLNLALLQVNLRAAEPNQILLWPEGAPGALGEREEDKPSLATYIAPQQTATGTAVIVCPGGAYVGLALDHEGRQVAQWFNSFGVTAFVLKYRLGSADGKRYHHPAPLQDAQRAIRLVRARAKEWDISPERIGIMGFSAGGHLASTAGTHFDNGNPSSSDEMERQNCRPNFMILVYPVISFRTKYTHRFSRQVLLGENADLDLVEDLSNETRVTSMTPPTFLIHTNEDDGVPPENSILFYMALREAKVPAELHIYERGEHGFGLAPKDAILSSWTKRCEDWMKVRGLLDKNSPN
ncbi:MAG TPA: alpha/beta hydrolase [Terriglobia bacterium]|nr:alpha/beta hydrolase [Terriglobia bacterium]